jgi:hypothetical protein
MKHAFLELKGTSREGQIRMRFLRISTLAGRDAQRPNRLLLNHNPIRRRCYRAEKAPHRNAGSFHPGGAWSD